MKVLMATDGSKHATLALASACRILSAQDRDIDVISVAPPAKIKSHSQKLCRHASHIVAAARAALAEDGVSVRSVVQPGSPAQVLIASSLNYDVTVLGAQSRKGRSSAGLGPIATRVMEHSNSTILIGREFHGEGGVKILAPVDGSEGSIGAIDKLVQLVDLSSADVTLVHVIETPWLHTGPDQEWIGYQENEEEIEPQAQWEQEFEREGDRILQEAQARLPVRTAVSTLVYRGLPADEILGEAETGGYDLVVMSVSGGTDLKHQILGSVSAKVAWNAPCSVLLVRPGSAD